MMTISTISPTAPKRLAAELHLEDGVVRPVWHTSGIEFIASGIHVPRGAIVTLRDGQRFLDAVRRMFARSTTVVVEDDAADVT